MRRAGQAGIPGQRPCRAGCQNTAPVFPLQFGENAAGAADIQIRFGYWAEQNSGSPTKVGDYRGLGDSPMFDIDGIRSNGRRTLNYTLTGMDSETSDAVLNYYQPGFQADVQYQRFPHRLNHDPLLQFTDVFDPAKPADFNVVKQDLNVGKDYAIRVQELKSSFKGRLTDDIKVRLDVWGMDKQGERQAKGMTHCFEDLYNTPPQYDGKKCHDLSQTQRISWQTIEVKPIVEWTVGPVVVEYSRPMRSFSQGDQIVDRLYTGPGVGSGSDPLNLPYDIVPNSFTQIDQLKISAVMNDDNKFYSLLMTGNTRKESDAMPPGTPDRVSSRQFGGADVRWTNTTLENVTLTTYGRVIDENNEPASFRIPGEEDTPGTQFDILTQQPINYERAQLGTKALWRPFGRGFGLGGLAINGGYEYASIHRSFATFPLEGTGPTFSEANTISHMAFVGPSVRWSSSLDTHVRYKWINSLNPLYGVEEGTGTTNTSLPEHENLIEIGGTWMPSESLMLTTWLNVDIRQNFNTGTFDEQSYPFGINGRYVVTRKWTVSGGYAYYNNWTNQDINFGSPGDTGSPDLGTIVTRWNYGGRARFSAWAVPTRRPSG